MPEQVEHTWSASKSVLFVGINIIVNMFDKGLSCILTQLLMRAIPGDTLTLIRNSGWRQRPLTREEMRTMDSLSDDSRVSLKQRLTLMFLLVSFTLTLIMGWIGIRLYFRNVKHEKTEIAVTAARFAADMVDPQKVDDYIKYGEKIPGYQQTEEMLYKIRSNAAGVKYLYVTQNLPEHFTNNQIMR